MGQVNAVLSGENPSKIEHRVIGRNGSTRWIESTLVPSYGTEGPLVSYDGIITDIIDRKIADEALRSANTYNRTLLEVSPDPMVTIDTDGKIKDLNSALEIMTGYHRDEIIGTNFSDYFIEPEAACAAYQTAFDKGLTRNLPLELKHRDGRQTSVLYNATVYKNESGEVLGVFAVARDISERKRLEREVAEISYKERYNLGTQLHDEVGQTLTGISFLFKVLEQRLRKRKGDEYRDIQKIKEELNVLIKKVRDMSKGLTAFKGMNGNIQDLLEVLASRTEDLYQIKCRVDSNCGSPAVSGVIVEQFYYIACEAVANAVKHGKPENIHINLYCTGEEIKLVVENDGPGFNPDKDCDQGIGTSIMKYRAGMIGAAFGIKRTTDGKTVVLCSVCL